MRYLFCFLLIFSITPTLASTADPTQIYGDTIEFDILRKGDVVGEHVTRFEKEGEKLRVTSRMNIDIFVLFLPVYAFDYQTTETWRDGKLMNLKANVLDGSDRLSFTAKRIQDDLTVNLQNETYSVKGPIFATNHWNVNVIKDKQVLNTLTGNLNDVTITPKGLEDIKTTNGTVTANRYDYSGDLKDTSVWYDDQGRWVKLQFLARDGSTIEYRCRTCIAR